VVSDKCVVVLREGPDCRDKRKKMQFLMCYARKLQEEGYDYSTSMKLAWKKIKEVCKI